MRFSELEAGHEFPAATLALDAETVERYLAATDDDNALYRRDGALWIVPPVAVAALSFQGIARGLSLEPGSLHTGQELSFRRLVTVGERLATQARVASSSKRRGFTGMALEVAATDDMGEDAISGRMTLMVAGQEGDVASGGGAARIAWPGFGAPAPVSYGALPAAAVAPGTELDVITRTVTQEHIDAYAVASGDHNPIHIDPQFAGRSPFGGTVAHGMLLLAYISTLMTRSFGLAWLDTGSLKVKFRNPARAGTTVTARGRVERVQEGDGVQYAVCAVALDNASGEALITGETRVHIK